MNKDRKVRKVKKIKQRFIIVAMLSMFAVVLVMIGGMNLWNYKNLTNKADMLTHMLAENNGVFPMQKSEKMLEYASDNAAEEKPEKPEEGKWHEMKPETPFQTRYFSLSYKDGKLTALSLAHIAAVGEKEAKEYGDQVREKAPDTGFFGIYRYRTTVMDGNINCVFVDCEEELTMMKETVWTSAIMSCAGLVAVFILLCVFSSIIFRPVEEAGKKQKQFITDAGHELKTPLTIIEANTDILEMEVGESKWIKSTRNQVHRMSGLVQQLVTLTRLDERGDGITKKEMNLSEIVVGTVDLFYPVAESKERVLQAEIEDDIRICGEEKCIRQMLELLFDNALKYSLCNSEIKIGLKTAPIPIKRSHRVIFYIENECEAIKKGDQSVLFERFYRGDESRNSLTGGSGIGLSVVRSVVEAHHGCVCAQSSDGRHLRIQVELPMC